MSNSRLVYSTESGRLCTNCRKPLPDCICPKKKPKTESASNTDGVIRIRREVKGRKGKTVTVLWGFDLDDIELGLLAKKIKQHCGTGGSVKDGAVVLQGDLREKIKSFLDREGYPAKLAGG